MATGRVPTTANSPLTAKGDLFGYSTAPARLAVGNNGESLVADSSASVGLRYTATPSASNPVLNSAFQIAQRGTSVAVAASTTAYTLDRWQLNTGANQASTVSQQATNDTTNLPNIQYCARVQRNSGQTGTSGMYFAQSMETVNSIPFVGKTASLSFYARAGANYSTASSAMIAFFNYGTGTDQNVLSGYTGGANVVATTVTLTTTWQRFTITGTVPTTAKELGYFFQATPSGTAGANDYFEVTGVQIDIGSVALPFRTYAATIQGELAACQRYYWRAYNLASSSDILLPTGIAIGTTQVNLFFVPSVSMRTTPTAVDYANVRLYDGVNVFNSPTLAVNTGSGTTMGISATTTGLTQFRPYYLIASNGTAYASYVGLAAEL